MDYDVLDQKVLKISSKKKICIEKLAVHSCLEIKQQVRWPKRQLLDLGEGHSHGYQGT